MNCPECGALSTPWMNCQTVFDECLVKEFTDPEFGAVHHLTVATFMLQHSSKLSPQGWLSMRQLLRDFLIGNKSPLEIRKQNKNFVDSGKRNWKISSPDGLGFITKNSWSKTILDVRLDNGGTYCADVTEWARAVLEDSEEITLSEPGN